MGKHHVLAGLLATTLLAGVAQAGSKEDIEAHLRAGRWQEAEVELHQVLEKHPTNATAHYWLAQAEYRQGRVQEAAAEARRALELDPSKKFAADPQLLETLLSGASARAEGSAGAQVPIAASPAVQDSQGSSHLLGWLIALALVVGSVVLWFATRSREQADQKAERELWSGRLRQAIEDLKDAVKASDANPQNGPEVKLANYDRANQLQSSIQSHLADIARRSEYSETQELIGRAHDVAAQIRGEELPSVRQQRLESERLAQQAAFQSTAPAYGPYGPAQTTGGPGVLGTVAAVGAGAAAGMLLAEAAEAATSHRVQHSDFDTPSRGPFPATAQPGLDLGGAAGTDADWSPSGGGADTGIDFGSGGGDDFS
ncbi:bacterial transcriptional activator domain-containing protein [Roseateles saccharophilus]|uniref:Tetratricopeptide repeat protein n=1 Tax=Roseateles saccharophilus TaxID=304 RepID=A0A4R3U7B3_ROSSA|nr:bacterial transcriptional activator domain-containing protein [Roseateles saccharophilus]TCU81737.1 tetratricopeptide repeat protein [Roseateles saccharophilus]